MTILSISVKKSLENKMSGSENKHGLIDRSVFKRVWQINQRILSDSFNTVRKLDWEPILCFNWRSKLLLDYFLF